MVDRPLSETISQWRKLAVAMNRHETLCARIMADCRDRADGSSSSWHPNFDEKIEETGRIAACSAALGVVEEDRKMTNTERSSGRGGLRAAESGDVSDLLNSADGGVEHTAASTRWGTEWRCSESTLASSSPIEPLHCSGLLPAYSAASVTSLHLVFGPCMRP